MWAFLNGFAIVTTTSGAKKARAQFVCVHHSEQRENWRKLEERLRRDAVAGGVISDRKRSNQNVSVWGVPEWCSG